VGEITELALLVPGGHGQLGTDLAALGARIGTVRAPGSADLRASISPIAGFAAWRTRPRLGRRRVRW